MRTPAHTRSWCPPLAAIGVAWLLLSCGDRTAVTDPEVCDSGAPPPCTAPPPPPPASCDIAVPVGRTCVAWKSADGPRAVSDPDTLDILIIEAGTEVRLAPGVVLAARRFLVDGTAAAPVRFLPLTAGSRWGGLALIGSSSDTSTMRHVRIESATRGIESVATGFDAPPLVLEDSHIQDVTGIGVMLHGGSIERTTIDGAGPAAIGIGSNSHGRIVDVTIRNGAGHGIALSCIRCYAFIGGGSIDNNVGDGIAAPGSGDSQSATVIFDAPVRITGNGGRPLVVPLSSLQGPMSDSAAQRNIIGNGTDSIIAHNGSGWGQQHVPPGPLVVHHFLPMRVAVSCSSALPLMSVEAGASLELTGSCAGPYGLFPLPILNGTASRPVTISGPVTGTGIVLSVPRQPGDTAFVQHARIRGIRLYAYQQPTSFQDIRFDSARVVLLAHGSSLRDVSSFGGGRWGSSAPQQEAAITVAADVSLHNARIESSAHHGIHVTAGSARITQCSVRGSAGHGILVEQGTAHIDWCNLTNNTGYAVHNATPDTILAPHVWRGDPAGPRGPGGDGIDGPIALDPVLAAPHVIASGSMAIASRPRTAFRLATSPPLLHSDPWITASDPVGNMLRNIEKL